MADPDLGGDPPCWAHMFDDDDGSSDSVGENGPFVVDMESVSSDSGGAIWSLPHGGDLDANLVRLDPGAEIGAHINSDVDVLMVVQSGTGELTVNGQTSRLDVHHLALIPKGAQRSVVADDKGITYLSVHRQRSPLGISR